MRGPAGGEGNSRGAWRGHWRVVGGGDWGVTEGDHRGVIGGVGGGRLEVGSGGWGCWGGGGGGRGVRGPTPHPRTSSNFEVNKRTKPKIKKDGGWGRWG